jgi:hypothetical protein
METIPPQKKHSRVLDIAVFLGALLVAFLAGIYVGIHPTWLPNTGIGGGSLNIHDLQDNPLAPPVQLTEPAREPTTQAAATRP